MKLYTSIQDRLRSQHESIAAIALNFSAERLLKCPSPGKWSIHDNIAHLAKYQPVFFERLKSILTGSKPWFERYKAEDDPAFSEWQQWNLRNLLDRLYADRQELSQFITSLSEPQLELIGIHPKFGSLTIVGWTEFFLLHEAHHIFTIFQLAHDIQLEDSREGNR